MRDCNATFFSIYLCLIGFYSLTELLNFDMISLRGSSLNNSLFTRLNNQSIISLVVDMK